MPRAFHGAWLRLEVGMIRDDFVERRFVNLALPVDLRNGDRTALDQVLDALGERPIYSAASARVKSRFTADIGAAIRLARASASLEMNCSSNTVGIPWEPHCSAI